MSAVAVGVVGLLVLALLGWAVLAPLRGGHRDMLLPAAPLLGVAMLAVVMSTTSWVTAAPGGLLATAVLAVGLVVLAVRRGRRPWRIGMRTWATAVGVTALGLLGASVALLPNAFVGDGGVMSPNSSHDIYYYVAEIDWLAEHPVAPGPRAGSVPGDGNATVADAPMEVALRLPLRIGQAMVQAALNVVTGQQAVDSVMVFTALWVLLTAPAAFVAARVLRMGPLVAVGLAVVSSTSVVLVQQYYQQNADALLGVGLALLVLATGLAAAERRLPVWPAALLLAGLVAVYTEYALFVAPALVGGVILRRGPRYRRTVGRSLLVVAAAVVVAPTAWARALGVLTIDRSGDALGSPLFSDGALAATARVVGTSPFGALVPSRATLILGALLAAGCLLAVLLDRYRGMWLGLLGVGFGYLALVTVAERGYTQLRAASLFVPLLLLAVAAGWGALLRVLRRRRPAPRVVRAVVASGLVVSTLVWAGVNLRSAVVGLDLAYAASRHVDETFEEAAGWVDDVGGDDGEDVTVLAPALYSQMWIAHALGDEPLVSYPALRPDYLGRTSHWAGEADRYLLIGPGAGLDADPAAVVAANDRFRLVDTQGHAVVATVPTELPAWSPAVGPDGAMLGPDLATLLVLRSAAAPAEVALDLTVPASDGPRQVGLTVLESGWTSTVTVPGGVSVPVEVDLGDLRVARVVVDIGADGTAATGPLIVNGVNA